jgi:hypothetical protein
MRWLSLFVLLVATLWTPNAARAVVPKWMSSLISSALNGWQSVQLVRFHVPLEVNGSVKTIEIALYNSRYDPDPIYRDNCVGSALDLAVDCDLNMIDEFADALHVADWVSPGKGAKAFVRKYMLMWVLSHELGHVSLGHDLSDFEDDAASAMFKADVQQKELHADAFAVTFIGDQKAANFEPYELVLDVSNALERRALCPDTFPKVCDKIPFGVGLIYDYTNSNPIRVPLGGSHPSFIVRFLRLLYLAGQRTARDNGINEEAQKSLDAIQVPGPNGQWLTLQSALTVSPNLPKD